MSELCSITLNLLVQDKQGNKIVEYHTGDEMRLQTIRQRMHEADQGGNQRQALRIVSFNAYEKINGTKRMSKRNNGKTK